MPLRSLTLLLASSLLLTLGACQRTPAPPTPGLDPDPEPSLSLFASDTEGPAPLEVTFAVEANTYTPDYRYDFDDGSEILFGSAVQTHVYEEPGVYTASVRIGGSEDFSEDSVTITVTQ